MSRTNAVHRLLDVHLQRGHGDAVALRTDERTVTYAGLHADACRAANAFAAAGVEAEHRVLLLMPDSPEYVACVLGLLRLGAVPVPLATQLAPDDYVRIAADCRPRAAVVGADEVRLVTHVRERVPFPGTVFTVGEVPAGTPFTSLAAAAAAAGDDAPIADVSLDDMAVIQYTSGSTGAPKGVVHLHRGLLAVLDGVPERLGLTPRDVCFSAAKLSFGYGFGNSLLFPLAVGASSILLGPRADGVRALDVVGRLRPTVLFAVPTLYAAMLGVAEARDDVDVSALRLCVSAGEPLPPSLAARWRDRFGLELLNGLGSTECLHIFVATVPGVTPPGSAGTTVPGYDAEVRDDDGRPLGPGETGHLWVRGEANGARYWNRHPETTRTMVGGWNRTGDQLYRDDDGVFWFVARSDDVLKIGGLKVAPQEIEECLREHAAVDACAVVGVPGDDGILVLTAYVRLRDDAGLAEPAARRELRTHVAGRLAAHKRPREVRFVEELPTTPTGKIARHVLRAEARAGVPA